MANRCRIREAIELATHVHDKLGRWLVLYGGGNLKKALNHQANAILSNCPLWFGAIRADGRTSARMDGLGVMAVFRR
jgi:hypothetical protein